MGLTYKKREMPKKGGESETFSTRRELQGGGKRKLAPTKTKANYNLGRSEGNGASMSGTRRGRT